MTKNQVDLVPQYNTLNMLDGFYLYNNFAMPPEKFSRKILIVEDEQPMMNALVDNLRAAGFSQILQAKNGQEGLDIALKEQPDLILLDIVMPKLDGMTMLKKLRESLSGKKPRVILLTNLTADESIMKGIVHDEPSYYLVKTDHSIDAVIEKVKETLSAPL
jgi:DNA-binding response OmpR family regulator